MIAHAGEACYPIMSPVSKQSYYMDLKTVSSSINMLTVKGIIKVASFLDAVVGEMSSDIVTDAA